MLAIRIQYDILYGCKQPYFDYRLYIMVPRLGHTIFINSVCKFCILRYVSLCSAHFAFTAICNRPSPPTAPSRRRNVLSGAPLRNSLTVSAADRARSRSRPKALTSSAHGKMTCCRVADLPIVSPLPCYDFRPCELNRATGTSSPTMDANSALHAGSAPMHMTRRSILHETVLHAIYAIYELTYMLSISTDCSK